MFKKTEGMYYITKIALFTVPRLQLLSNMSTSFCDKVLKYKTECKGLSTFGEH